MSAHIRWATNGIIPFRLPQRPCHWGWGKLTKLTKLIKRNGHRIFTGWERWENKNTAATEGNTLTEWNYISLNSNTPINLLNNDNKKIKKSEMLRQKITVAFLNGSRYDWTQHVLGPWGTVSVSATNLGKASFSSVLNAPLWSRLINCRPWGPKGGHFLAVLHRLLRLTYEKWGSGTSNYPENTDSRRVERSVEWWDRQTIVPNYRERMRETCLAWVCLYKGCVILWKLKNNLTIFYHVLEHDRHSSSSQKLYAALCSFMNALRSFMNALWSIKAIPLVWDLSLVNYRFRAL